jgi:PDZ domain-containing protein
MNKIIKKIKEYKFYIIITIICILLYNIHLPYYVLTPGGTISLNNRIEISDNSSLDGSMNLLYVNQYNATIPTYLMSYLFKNWDLEKVEEQQLNNESVEEIYERNQIMLNNSIQNAVFVAYNYANKDIDIKGVTNYVVATTTDNNFKIGDIVTKVDDNDVNNLKEIQEIIKSKEVGDIINFTIIRDNEEITIQNEVKEQEGNKVVGVVILTNYEYTTDPEIEFKFKDSESGSSGGLMLALTIYDLISDDNLAQGRNIAGTGTINIDGTVGEIAGVKYKIMGAVKNKMDLILVPEANYEEAMQVKEDFNYDIEIVSIKTFEEAVNYLKEN